MNVSEPTPSGALLEESEWLHALARRLVRDPALAGDAAQQTLLSEAGESPLTQTDDSARFLILYRGNQIVSRVPLKLVAGEVNEIRL